MEEHRSDDQRKRKCRRITKTVAQLIVDTRNYFELEARRGERIDVTRPLNRTAACLDFGVSTVKSVCKKLRDGDDFPNDEELEERNRKCQVPRAIFPVVRKVLFGMYRDNKHVTLDSLLKELQTRRSTRNSSWTWSRATLHRVLTENMGFTYGSRPNHYKAIKEKQSIALQRIQYIQHVRRYREEGRLVFYQDETWVTKNMTPSGVWLDEDSNGGLAVPSGTGMRSIVCHVGNELGFIEGAELIFRGKNALQGSDYHTAMNAAVFLDWLEKKVFPVLPPRSVLVIDRATYHTVLTEESKSAASNLRKSQLIDWLLEKKVEYTIDGVAFRTLEDYTKLKVVELAAICNENKPKPVF